MIAPKREFRWKWGVWECIGTIQPDPMVEDLGVCPNPDNLVLGQKQFREPEFWGLSESMVKEIESACLIAWVDHELDRVEMEAEEYADRVRMQREGGDA